MFFIFLLFMWACPFVAAMPFWCHVWYSIKELEKRCKVWKFAGKTITVQITRLVMLDFHRSPLEALNNDQLCQNESWNNKKLHWRIGIQKRLSELVREDRASSLENPFAFAWESWNWLWALGNVGDGVSRPLDGWNKILPVTKERLGHWLDLPWLDESWSLKMKPKNQNARPIAGCDEAGRVSGCRRKRIIGDGEAI